MDRNQISTSFKEIQEYICSKLESIDGLSSFEADVWSREDGGGGRTNTVKEGAVIEKGGVAFSEVFGPVTEQMTKQLKLEGDSFLSNLELK